MRDETVALSDWLEAEELRAVHRACPDATRRALGLELVESEDALISFAVNEPSILWNRALIHGAARPAPLGVVRDVVREFSARAIADYFIQLERQALEATDTDLAALGLVKARAWQRFERGNAPPPVPRTTLVVRKLQDPRPELSRAFAELIVEGFGLQASALPLFEAVARSDSWMSFMSFAGDEPAGVGALLVRRGLRSGELLGWLDMGATAPRFRGRGGQQAVLAARIEAARELGCTRLFTETGEAVPGDPQHSYHNILRAGFSPSELRENWRPKPRPSSPRSG